MAGSPPVGETGRWPTVVTMVMDASGHHGDDCQWSLFLGRSRVTVFLWTRETKVPVRPKKTKDVVLLREYCSCYCYYVL